MKQASLIDLMLGAANETDPDGWFFLREEKMTPESDALLIGNDEYEDLEEELHEIAAATGFPRESLDSRTVASIVDGVYLMTPHPTPEQLIRAYTYYAEFDAFLPSLDAPDPPPVEEAILASDREFFEKLGEEDLARRCRREGCTNGSVYLSVFCARHHFENVRKRPCPF